VAKPPFVMVLFRHALQVSIAGDCACAGQRCHFAGEDLGQLQVSQFAGDCVHLQGGRCSIVASRDAGEPLRGGSPASWQALARRLENPKHAMWYNLEPVATLKILPNDAFGVPQPLGERLPRGWGPPRGGFSSLPREAKFPRYVEHRPLTPSTTHIHAQAAPGCEPHCHRRKKIPGTTAAATSLLSSGCAPRWPRPTSATRGYFFLRM
jgi:hypothetical protein